MRAALIGTGQIAREHLACLKELPRVEVAGVCDLSPALAELTAERFGIPAWFTDHRKMLEALKPDVVHVTTSPASHFQLAADALQAGAHVFVEKPITTSHDDFLILKRYAEEKRRVLIEDHNYLFNDCSQRVLGLIKSGDFGGVNHVEVFFCVNILSPLSPFADPNAPHPCLALPGGAIADFLPHLAYLTYAFVGPHRAVRTLWRKKDAGSPLPSEEFRALVEASGGTAALGFSAHSQPSVFAVRVYGTKMQAGVNLLEGHVTIDRVRPGRQALASLRGGLEEAWCSGRDAIGGFWRRLSGRPLAYEGMWEVLRRTYEALEARAEPPISLAQVEAVSRLVGDLTREEYQL